MQVVFNLVILFLISWLWFLPYIIFGHASENNNICEIILSVYGFLIVTLCFWYLVLSTPLAEHFFLASFLTCTKLFASLVFHAVDLLGTLNKPILWNTRDTNVFVHVIKLARKKRSVSGVFSLQSGKKMKTSF